MLIVWPQDIAFAGAWKRLIFSLCLSVCVSLPLCLSVSLFLCVCVSVCLILSLISTQACTHSLLNWVLFPVDFNNGEFWSWFFFSYSSSSLSEGKVLVSLLIHTSESWILCFESLLHLPAHHFCSVTIRGVSLPSNCGQLKCTLLFRKKQIKEDVCCISESNSEVYQSSLNIQVGSSDLCQTVKPIAKFIF